MMSRVLLRTSLLVFPFTLWAQPVVSVHSGVVHYFEGSVLIDGQPLEERFGRFEEIRPNSELRTDQGRAEILLTPGVLLRVDENSSIRMISNRLSDTRVEFIGGTVAIDSRNGSPGAPITLTFRKYEVHFRTLGCYRFDSAPPRLRVDEGEASVAFNGNTASVTANQAISLTPVLTPQPHVTNPDDSLDRWARERSESVAADNASAAASDNLSATLDNPQDPVYGGGGYSGGYGGGYNLGDPTYFSPGDLWLSNAGLQPWNLFPGQMFGYIFVPVYRRLPPLGYRPPYAPIRSGPYVPSTTRRPMVHTTPAITVHHSTGMAVHAAHR